MGRRDEDVIWTVSLDRMAAMGYQLTCPTGELVAYVDDECIRDERSVDP
jgi:hypothetical protein